MQAIETVYIGPTNTKPGRIRASCDAKTIVVSWDHNHDIEDNHIAAARNLCQQLGWVGPRYNFHTGSIKGRGYVLGFDSGTATRASAAKAPKKPAAKRKPASKRGPAKKK